MQAESTSVARIWPVAAKPAARIPWWRQFWLVAQLQYSEYRETAVVMMLFSLVFPLGMVWLFGGMLMSQGPGSTWVLAGNAVVAVSTGSSVFVLWRVGLLRLNHQLDYYATLPISKSAFLAAVFCISQITALPGLVASMLGGHWLLGVPLTSILAGLPLALLAAACLTMVAAMVGAMAKTVGHLNLANNLSTFIVIFLSPTMVPIEKLPAVFRLTSYLLPTGQAILALTEALSGRYGERFWTSTGLLVAWTVAAFVLCFRKLDWRAD